MNTSLTNASVQQVPHNSDHNHNHNHSYQHTTTNCHH
jgi:hypothetical protein